MQQQMTTNVQAVGGEMIDDSSEEDYMLKSLFIEKSENVTTLSKKKVKKIKDVRTKLKQNKNKEEMEKKLKNIEVTHQQMTKNVKEVGSKMIDDSSEEDYIFKFIFKQESENVATSPEKNVKETKDVRKKKKQNKNEEEMEKELKNIEVTHQQMTKTAKEVGSEMMDESSEEDYMLKSLFIEKPENVATSSKKNVKEIKDVRKNLEQNRNEEKDEKVDKHQYKNIEETQQQMTTTVEVSHKDKLNKVGYMCVSVSVWQSENFATLLEKNDKKIKYVPKKFEQNKEELKNAKVIQEQITTNTKTAGVEMTLVPNKIDDKKCELMKQDAHLRQYVIEEIKQKMNENDVSPYTKNTSKISRKDYITLPSVTLQMTRMKEDYYHVTPRPTNFAGESDKSMKLLKKAEEYNKDSLINLMEDFHSIKNMINKTIIKMWELLEDMKMIDL